MQKYPSLSQKSKDQSYTDNQHSVIIIQQCLYVSKPEFLTVELQPSTFTVGGDFESLNTSNRPVMNS